MDDFNFDIVNFPFLDGDVPQRPSYGVYILNDTSNVDDSVFAIFQKRLEQLNPQPCFLDMEGFLFLCSFSII